MASYCGWRTEADIQADLSQIGFMYRFNNGPAEEDDALKEKTVEEEEIREPDFALIQSEVSRLRGISGLNEEAVFQPRQLHRPRFTTVESMRATHDAFLRKQKEDALIKEEEKKDKEKLKTRQQAMRKRNVLLNTILKETKEAEQKHSYDSTGSRDSGKTNVTSPEQIFINETDDSVKSNSRKVCKVSFNKFARGKKAVPGEAIVDLNRVCQKLREHYAEPEDPYSYISSPPPKESKERSKPSPMTFYKTIQEEEEGRPDYNSEADFPSLPKK